MPPRIDTEAKPVNHDEHLRSHARCAHVLAPFGEDTFGRRAEAFARLFGTPTFLIVQTAIVAVWIALNVAAASLRWDPYRFILLNLAFSLQAAYAALLILLAQTRQADRDKTLSAADADHREALANQSLERQELAAEQGRQLHALLQANTELTEQTRNLAEQLKTADPRDPRSRRRLILSQWPSAAVNSCVR
jgi:uncharacterized membrane protein